MSAIAVTRAPASRSMSQTMCAIEGELVLEVVVDHRLVDAGGAGDVVDDDAVEAAAREGVGGGGENGGAGGAGVDAFARAAAAAGARTGARVGRVGGRTACSSLTKWLVKTRRLSRPKPAMLGPSANRARQACTRPRRRSR